MHTLFDAHCHLSEHVGKEPVADDTESTISGRILCAVEPSEWQRLSETSKGWSGTRAAYGVHPWFVMKADGDWLESLEKWLVAEPDAWLGEAGLDGLRTDSADEEVQAKAFAGQLHLAARLDRHANLHCVKAWNGLLRHLDDEYLAGGAGRRFIVHSFLGPHQVIKLLTERGAYFSVGQLLFRKDSRRHRERVALLPEDRLLLESDTKVEACVDAINALEHALVWLAGVRKMSVAALAELLTENTRRLVNDD